MDPFDAITRYVAQQARAANRQYPYLEAEDLAQDALLRALKSGLDPSKHTQGECMVFCRKALHYVVLDCLRRRGTPVTASSLDSGDPDEGSWLDRIEDSSPGPFASAELVDLKHDLQQRIELLDDVQRDALKRRLAGQTFEEIGQANGRSTASAHRLVKQAESQLRKSMESSAASCGPPGCGYMTRPTAVDLVEAAGDSPNSTQMEDESEG